MKRLTEKVIVKCDGRTEYRMTDASGYDLKTIFDKLGQLEDIEEELGIELAQLKKKHKYLIIDREMFIKNLCKKVFETENGFRIQIGACLNCDEETKKAIPDMLKNQVVQALLREIELLTKEEL